MTFYALYLADFQCSTSITTYLVLGDKNKINMRVSFTHFSPTLICFSNGAVLMKTDTTTNYTKVEAEKVLEGYVTGTVTPKDKNTNKLLCGFLYDSSDVGKANELIHLYGISPNSLIDSFQPNMLFPEDFDKVICEFPVIVECL